MILVPWNFLVRLAGPRLARRIFPILVKQLLNFLTPLWGGKPTDLQKRVDELERINEAQATQLRWLTVIVMLSVAMGAVAIVALVIVVLR